MEKPHKVTFNRAIDGNWYATAIKRAESREERFPGNLTHTDGLPPMADFLKYMETEGYRPLGKLPDDKTKPPTGGVVVVFAPIPPPTFTQRISQGIEASKKEAQGEPSAPEKPAPPDAAYAETRRHLRDVF